MIPASGERGAPTRCDPRMLVRPVQKADESDAGFVLRVAHQNGLARPVWLGAALGTSVAARDLGRARWCSACLSEQEPRWRAAWVRGPALCATHQCWLEDACPACGREGNWRSLRLLRCRCAADLSSSTISPWSDEVRALLTVRSDTSDEGWVGLTVDSRWRVAKLLGALDQHGLRGKPLKRATAAGVEVERRLVTVGATLMLGAPRSIADLLVRIRSVPIAGRAQLAAEAFPGLLPMLRNRLDERGSAWLMQQVRRFTAGSLELGTPVVWRQRATGSNSCARAVGELLGVGPDRVGSLASTLGVAHAGRVTRSGRRMIIVAPSAVGQMRARLADGLSMSAAADQFGLSRPRLEKLLQAGRIDRAGRGVSREQLSRLVTRVAENARGAKGRLQSSMLSLAEAMRLLIPSARTVDFIDALVGGAVPVIAASKHVVGFRDLHIDREAARSALRPVPGPEGLLSVPQAAAALGLKQEVAYHLVRTGLLRCARRTAGRRAASFIDPAELERFRTAFQPLAAIAARERIGNRAALAWAKAVGLELASGPAVDGGRQYFVRVHRRDPNLQGDQHGPLGAIDDC